MTDVLFSIDRAIFLFLNRTIATPVGDLLWPLITDYDKLWPVRIVLLGVWLWLMVRGGVRGRTAALMLIPVLFLSDRISSSFIKDLVSRPRPCHEVDGVAIIQGIHLLVDCGPGKSFPSSHAVNNFAVATLFSFYYRKWLPAFVAGASLVALSRPAVGVHYPSDILAGACLGTGIALGVIMVWTRVQNRFFPSLQIPPPPLPPA